MRKIAHFGRKLALKICIFAKITSKTEQFHAHFIWQVFWDWKIFIKLLQCALSPSSGEIKKRTLLNTTSAHCKNFMKIFQSQKTCQIKWAWNCSVLLVILAKMQNFKDNFQPDGRKISFQRVFRKDWKNLLMLVGSLAEGWRLKKLFRFL